MCKIDGAQSAISAFLGVSCKKWPIGWDFVDIDWRLPQPKSPPLLCIAGSSSSNWTWPDPGTNTTSENISSLSGRVYSSPLRWFSCRDHVILLIGKLCESQRVEAEQLEDIKGIPVNMFCIKMIQFNKNQWIKFWFCTVIGTKDACKQPSESLYHCIKQESFCGSVTSEKVLNWMSN